MTTKQSGIYFDESRCVECRTCETACKSARNVEPGVQLIRVTGTWKGNYPDVALSFFTLFCMHCAKPACAEACPTGAIIKRAEDGIMTVDSGKCNGCRECLAACPFGVPQFDKSGKLQLCDFCMSTGNPPSCAQSCPAEALYIGDLEDLQKIAKDKGKKVRKLDGTTNPSIIIVR
jgi:anaerobic dimethyl sulfoxide reductase subunit B